MRRTHDVTELTCAVLQEIARAKEAIRKDGRHRLVEKWQMRWHGKQTGRWTYRLIPGLATWLNRKHGEVGASRRETRRFVATVISLWIMQSKHSSSAQNGVWQGRPSVRQWVPSLLLTRWSLSCSSLSGSGRSSSHSSNLWWRRESSMGAEIETTGRASRNRIGACSRGPAPRADSTVRVVRGRILFSLLLAGAACRST